MTLAGLQDLAAAIDTLLCIARRETLVLAIASGAMDDDGVAVASARLRWSIGSARQLIATFDHDPFMKHRVRRLEWIADRAQRWFVTEPSQSLHAIGNLVERAAAQRDQHAPAINAQHARLVDLDLDDLELGSISLHGASLTDVTARRVSCEAADASATRWHRCQLDSSALAMAVFSGSTLEHCELSRANLEGTSWHRATLSHTSLRRAILIDARLDRAAFSDCNLRGADLEIVRSRNVATLAGARFVRCDLRDTNWAGRELGGATFIDCKLFGAHGVPMLAGVMIERPDLSLGADGSQIGTQDDAVAGWRTIAGAGASLPSGASPPGTRPSN